MKTITAAEFDKKVEIEFAYLNHVNRLNPEVAQKKAYEIVASEYQKE